MLGKEAGELNIIIHYPTSPEGIAALRDKVAGEHAAVVSRYLQNLPCPKEQKLALIKAMQDGIKS